MLALTEMHHPSRRLTHTENYTRDTEYTMYRSAETEMQNKILLRHFKVKF